MNHSIGNCTYDNDAKRQDGNVLLKFDIAVKSNEYVATLVGALHQFTIEHATPAKFDNCTDIVASQFRSEVNRDIFVKKNAHQPQENHMLNPKRLSPARA